MKYLAADPRDVFGTISPPPELQPFIQKGGAGAGGISLFLNNLLSLLYIAAAALVVFMLVWGSLEWIMSGGDKEALGKAQKRIIHALIGMAMLALVFLILKVLGQFLGFQFFQAPSGYQLWGVP